MRLRPPSLRPQRSDEFDLRVLKRMVDVLQLFSDEALGQLRTRQRASFVSTKNCSCDQCQQVIMNPLPRLIEIDRLDAHSTSLVGI
jgi:hypothetical protein